MAITYDNGLSPLLYDSVLTSAAAAPAFIATPLFDASTEKVAFIGNVWHPTVRTGTINLRKVLFRTGAVSLNAASEVRVSLQDVSVTAGPPFQPDGTQDQFYDFKAATTTLAANSWQSTGALSADRTVTLASDSATDSNPRRLAVVFEYQVFTAADSAIISGLNNQADSSNLAGTILNTGTWAWLGGAIVAFECDDGTNAFLIGAYPISATSSVAVSSTGAIRRAGLRFRFPTTRAIDRAALAFRVPNGADGRLVLYDSDGTTELRSVDVDNDDARAATTDSLFEVPFEPVTLTANTYYRFAYVGSVATAATVYYLDVNAAGLMDGFILGQDGHWTQHDGSNWTETMTRRPVFGLGVCGYDIGSGGGGGLLVHPGMMGGMRG